MNVHQQYKIYITNSIIWIDSIWPCRGNCRQRADQHSIQAQHWLRIQSESKKERMKTPLLVVPYIHVGDNAITSASVITTIWVEVNRSKANKRKVDSSEVNGKQTEGRDCKRNTNTKLYKCLSSAACRSNGSVQQEQLIQRRKTWVKLEVVGVSLAVRWDVAGSGWGHKEHLSYEDPDPAGVLPWP